MSKIKHYFQGKDLIQRIYYNEKNKPYLILDYYINNCGSVKSEVYVNHNNHYHNDNGPAIITYYKNGNKNEEYYYKNGIPFRHDQSLPIYIKYFKNQKVYMKQYQDGNIIKYLKRDNVN